MDCVLFHWRVYWSRTSAGPHPLREWLARAWGTLARRLADDDLERELQSHLELAADQARRAPRATRTRGGRPA